MFCRNTIRQRPAVFWVAARERFVLPSRQRWIYFATFCSKWGCWTNKFRIDKNLVKGVKTTKSLQVIGKTAKINSKILPVAPGQFDILNLESEKNEISLNEGAPQGAPSNFWGVFGAPRSRGDEPCRFRMSCTAREILRPAGKARAFGMTPGWGKSG